MPYLEILGPSVGATEKRIAVEAVTEAIVSAFAVGVETVTVYFLPVAEGDYGHAGSMGTAGRHMRIFAKLHAYRRGVAERRAAAAGVTAALARCFATAPEAIAVYFMDRAPDEVAHAGTMACDDAPTAAPGLRPAAAPSAFAK